MELHSIRLLSLEMYKKKQQKHIATAQTQLLKAKEKSQKYVPGTINLQILGNGANGAPSSVYLFTDQSRYVQQQTLIFEKYHNLFVPQVPFQLW